MSTAAPPTGLPAAIPAPVTSQGPPDLSELFKLTVEQYEHMAEVGVLQSDEPIELLEGYLVRKMTKYAPHTTATQLVRIAVERLLPAGWLYRTQDPIRLDDSEPEPDGAVVVGDVRTYSARHPLAAEVALVIEVADSTLVRDREWKRRIYARNGIPVYWVVNLIDRQLEVFTDPSGPGSSPDYGTTRVLSTGDRIDVVVGGTVVGAVAVTDMLP